MEALDGQRQGLVHIRRPASLAAPQREVGDPRPDTDGSWGQTCTSFPVVPPEP